MQSVQRVVASTPIRNSLEFEIFGNQAGGMSLKNLVGHFRPHRVLIEKEAVGQGSVVITLDRLPREKEDDAGFCKRIMSTIERSATVTFMHMER